MELKENTSPAEWNGVLGREAFFWTQLKLLVIFGALSIIPFLIFLDGQKRYSDGSIVTGVAIGCLIGLGYAVLSFIAIWKRIRDIRGTTEYEGWAIVIFLAIVSTCVNEVAAGVYGVPLWFFIYLKKGAVTSTDAIKLEEIFDRIVREIKR